MTRLTPDNDTLKERSETFDAPPKQTIGERISWLRTRAGLTQAQLAELTGINQSNIARWESGNQTPSQISAAKVATALGTTTDYLIRGIATRPDAQSRPVIGYVGAGEAVYPINGDDSALEHTDVPFGTPDHVVGLRIKGDSMRGQFEDADIILYNRETPFLLQDCINRRCVVQLEDGRILVKKLKFGQMEGHFTLLSTNAPAIENVKILWASPILGVVFT